MRVALEHATDPHHQLFTRLPVVLRLFALEKWEHLGELALQIFRTRNLSISKFQRRMTHINHGDFVRCRRRCA